MKLVIGSRKSDLARIQAYAVGRELLKLPQVESIDYLFKTSLGDQNQDDPLWKMPEKGVFTQDLTKDLIDEEISLVVHSWKDLPVEEHPETTIAGTMARGDQRDLLLFKKEALEALVKNEDIQVFSSSPRRAYNLSRFLSWALPGGKAKIEFKDVRGNIQTRVRKLLDSDDIHGLVVAKAAIDRMLSAKEEEFKDSWELLRTALEQCLYMVLPLKENPTAAAQGALAIEVKRDNKDLIELVGKINCSDTFDCVQKERQVLAQHGGGCHQKIGVSFLKRDYGEIKSLKGLTEAGVELDEWRLTAERKKYEAKASEIFPLEMKQARLANDENIEVKEEPLAGCKAVFVAKSRAFPVGWIPELDQWLWVAGSRTWRKLAEIGLWINGSAEALGDCEDARLENIAGPVNWTKLTHEEALAYSEGPAIATYRLTESKIPADLEAKKCFYWTSYSSFKRALTQFPAIQNAQHACGPGKTAELIEKELGRKPDVFLSYKEWRNEFQ